MGRGCGVSQALAHNVQSTLVCQAPELPCMVDDSRPKGFQARLQEARANYSAPGRRRLGMSQTELAGLIGVEQATVSLWELQGVEPSLARIERTAAALGVRVCWLAFGELPMRPEDGPDEVVEPESVTFVPPVSPAETPRDARPAKKRRTGR